MKTWWISFVSNEDHRGVCIVDAPDQCGALNRVRELKIHPGGEAVFCEMPIESLDEIVRWGRDRLIGTKELKDAGYMKLSDLPNEVAERIRRDPSVSRACEDH